MLNQLLFFNFLLLIDLIMISYARRRHLQLVRSHVGLGALVLLHHPALLFLAWHLRSLVRIWNQLEIHLSLLLRNC